MNLNDDAITEFQELYERHYGIRLNESDAKAEALDLIAIVATIQSTELNKDDEVSYND